MRSYTMQATRRMESKSTEDHNSMSTKKKCCYCCLVTSLVTLMVLTIVSLGIGISNATLAPRLSRLSQLHSSQLDSLDSSQLDSLENSVTSLRADLTSSTQGLTNSIQATSTSLRAQFTNLQTRVQSNAAVFSSCREVREECTVRPGTGDFVATCSTAFLSNRQTVSDAHHLQDMVTVGMRCQYEGTINSDYFRTATLRRSTFGNVACDCQVTRPNIDTGGHSALPINLADRCALVITRCPAAQRIF